MIDWGDQECFGALIDLIESASDRYAHLAFGIGVESKNHVLVLKLCSNLFMSMTDDDDEVLDTGTTQAGDAALDYCTAAKGKERLKRAHALRATGGEDDC